MQKGYEHSLPKEKKTTSSRFVLIFRNGMAGSVNKDSGFSLMDHRTVSAMKKDNSIIFGHIDGLREGDNTYTRSQLFTSKAHRYVLVGFLFYSENTFLFK